MNNHASFNEVFLVAGPRIPRSFVVGAVGDGWRAALTTLAFERRFGAIPPPRYTSTHGRTVSEALLESEEHFKTYKWYPQRAGRVDLVIDRARSTGTSTNPVVRQEIARLICLHQASGWTADECPWGAGPRTHARSGGLDRKARHQSDCPSGSQSAFDDRRRSRSLDPVLTARWTASLPRS